MHGTVRPPWIIVTRELDCTPVRVQFGKLRLAQFARYWHRDRSLPSGDQWRLLSADEMQKAGRRLPSYGIIEMLAQRGALLWAEEAPSKPGAYKVNKEDLMLRPCYLERGNGSTLYHGLDAATTQFDMQSLQSMTWDTDFVILFVDSDLAPACNRMKMNVRMHAMEHNEQTAPTQGKFLFVSGECLGHRFHRDIEQTSESKTLIPKLYSTSFSFSLADTYSKVLIELRSIIEEDLVVGFYPGTPPPDGPWKGHCNALVTFLIGRLIKDEEARVPILKEWREVINFDFRQGFFQHYCFKQGCCEGQQRHIAVERIFSLLVDVVVGKLGTDLPSITRWYTFEKHLHCQTLGQITAQLLPRLVRRSFTEEQRADDEDPDDYHGQVSKKKKQSLEFHTGREDTSLELLLASRFVSPVGDMSLRLQELDGGGSAVAHLCNISFETGILFKCQRELFEAFSFWDLRDSGAYMAGACNHMESFQIPRSRMIDEARAYATSLGAAVYCVELKFHSWPWRQLSGHFLVGKRVRSARSGRVSQDGQELVHEQFWTSRSCCRDKYWSEPVHSRLRSQDDLRSSSMVQLRATLARHLKATNMNLESDISEIRASVPSTKRAPNAEKQLYLAHLDRLMKVHLRNGHADCRGEESRDELLARGLALEGRSAPSWRRPDNAALNAALNVAVAGPVALGPCDGPSGFVPQLAPTDDGVHSCSALRARVVRCAVQNILCVLLIVALLEVAPRISMVAR